MGVSVGLELTRSFGRYRLWLGRGSLCGEGKKVDGVHR